MSRFINALKKAIPGTSSETSAGDCFNASASAVRFFRSPAVPDAQRRSAHHGPHQRRASVRSARAVRSDLSYTVSCIRVQAVRPPRNTARTGGKSAAFCLYLARKDCFYTEIFLNEPLQFSVVFAIIISASNETGDPYEFDLSGMQRNADRGRKTVCVSGRTQL